MKKRVVALVLLGVILCASLTAQASWKGHETPLVLVTSTMVYSEAGDLDKPMDKVNGSDITLLLNSEDGWYQIAYTSGGNEKRGWVPGTVVDHLNALPAGQTPQQAVRLEVICQSLTLREDAKGSAKRVANIPNGAHVYQLDEAEEWIKVRYMQEGKDYVVNELEGWVHRDYIMWNPEHITLRKSTKAYAHPFGDSPVLNTVGAGTRLTVLGETDDYWIVNFRSASAFISKKADVATEQEVIAGL